MMKVLKSNVKEHKNLKKIIFEILVDQT